MKHNGKKKKIKKSLVDEKEKRSKVVCIAKVRMSFAYHLLQQVGHNADSRLLAATVKRAIGSATWFTRPLDKEKETGQRKFNSS